MRPLFALLLALPAAVLVCAGCATQPATSDGMVAAPSSRLDEFYVRPNSDVASYRRVIIERVPVQFHPDYLSQKHGFNYLLAQPMSQPYQDAESTAQDLGTLMQASLADAFHASGYELVAAPGPGVLRISAKISELYINAPDRLSSSVRATFNRDTGTATLTLDAADAASGDVLARVVHRNIVREVRRLNIADDSTNRFWFETAFRRWASNVTAELGAPRQTQVSVAAQR
jgi:hypothetical protein